jgi:hypothetical protein
MCQLSVQGKEKEGGGQYRSSSSSFVGSTEASPAKSRHCHHVDTKRTVSFEKVADGRSGVRKRGSQKVEGHLTSHFTLLPLTSLHFTSSHFNSLPLTSLPLTSLHFTSLHFTSLHFTSSRFPLLLFYFLSLHFTSSHFTSLPLTSLPLTSLYHLTLRPLTSYRTSIERSVNLINLPLLLHSESDLFLVNSFVNIVTIGSVTASRSYWPKLVPAGTFFRRRSSLLERNLWLAKSSQALSSHRKYRLKQSVHSSCFVACMRWMRLERHVCVYFYNWCVFDV